MGKGGCMGDNPIHEQCTAHSGATAKMNLLLVLLSTVLALTGYNVVLTFTLQATIAGYSQRFDSVDARYTGLESGLDDVRREVEATQRRIEELERRR